MQTKIDKRLKQLRAKAGYTQASVADTIEIGRTAYQSYEEGRAMPPLKTLLKLADMYGFLTVNELMGMAVPDINPVIAKYAALSSDKRKIVDFILDGKC